MAAVNLKTPVSKNLLLLHFTVMIWGFTGSLGSLISIGATGLVWYRVVIATVSLLVYFVATGKSFAVSRSAFFKLALTGALVCGHWILFFASIKLSTVPVALVCLSSLTLFTAVFEPLFNRTRISKLEILSGIMIICGIVLIFKFEIRYTKGIIAGLSCAMLASLFSIINSKHVKVHQAPVIAFYELSGAIFWISLYLFATHGFNQTMVPTHSDMVYLFILGTVCTSLAYVIGVHVMRELSAFRVALITNLEPVYGIVIAFFIFGDINKMTPGFWAGAAIILATIFLHPVAQKQFSARKKHA